MPLIFVSYRRTDAPGHAGRLYDRLVDRFGEANVFKDVDSTEPGADFVEVIRDTVGKCDALLAVIGRDWLGPGEPGSRRLDDPQDWVRVEIGDALHRKIRVVPVLVEGASMPSPTDLPDELGALARRQAFELTEASWNAQVAQLIDRLDSAAGRTARVNFDGRAGERVSFGFEDVTIGGGGENVMTASILDPKGQEVGAAFDLLNLDDEVIDAQTLPATGTYTLVVDPDDTNTGKATVTMHTRPAGDDGDLAPGRARTVAIDGVGQTARLTFAGREGERVSFGFAGVTIGGGGANVMSASILDPKGQQVGETSNVLGLDDDVIEAQTLPATGTYTLVIDPDGTNTGRATVRLRARR